MTPSSKDHPRPRRHPRWGNSKPARVCDGEAVLINATKSCRPQSLMFLAEQLNRVIQSFSLKPRLLLCISLVFPTGAERLRVGFAPAFFERDNISVAVLSEPHAAVVHSLMKQIEGSRMTAFPPNKHHSP